MSNPAQEEVDRLFSQKHTHSRPHPEDTGDSDDGSIDEEDTSEPAYANNPDVDIDDEEISHRMGAMTTTKQTYTVPTTVQYANTGPKGVIADAQSFARAKRDALKNPVPTVTNVAVPHNSNNYISKQRERGSGSDEEEEDDEFMEQWRSRRLAELSSKPNPQNMLNAQHTHARRVSPSRRTYGSAVNVDAAGYLDAIEKVSSETTVVVMIYNSGSAQSDEVEDEIEILAYKYGYVRFVKLDHEVAEMEHIQIPALLAYKGGEVYATISGAKKGGLEKVLAQQGVFS